MSVPPPASDPTKRAWKRLNWNLCDMAMNITIPAGYPLAGMNLPVDMVGEYCNYYYTNVYYGF